MIFLRKFKKTSWASLLLLLFIHVPVGKAQGPIAGGYTPEFSANLGYSYTSASIPSQTRLPMTGVTGGWTAELKPHFGVEIEGSFLRNYHAYGTQYAANLITYMGGPVFHPMRGRRLDIYVHGLLGGAMETGVNYDPNGNLLHGYVNKTAWEVGGGAEYLFDRSISLRFGADYLHTSFFTPVISITGQYNLRATVGATYRFGGRRE